MSPTQLQASHSSPPKESDGGFKKGVSAAASAMMRTMGPLVRDHHLWEQGETLALGVSGGKDSMTLGWVLSHAQELSLPDCRVVALHVPPPGNCPCAFQAATLADEVLGWPGVQLKILDNASPLPETCDRCARERRRRLFESCHDNGITTLVLAHHQDDLVQTLLMNMMFHGEMASTMRPIRYFGGGSIRVIRPLLTTPEKRVIATARRLGYLRPALTTEPNGFGPEKSQRTAIRSFLHSLGPRRDIVKANLARLSRQTWETPEAYVQPGS